MHFKDVKLKAICKRLSIPIKNADVVTSMLKLLSNVYTMKAKITGLGDDGPALWIKPLYDEDRQKFEKRLEKNL